MRRLMIGLMLVCCGGFAALAAADSPVQLSLKDGRVLSGDIVAESANELRLLVSQGKMSMEVRIDPADIVARETLSGEAPTVQRPADGRRAAASTDGDAAEAVAATEVSPSADYHQRLRRALGRHLFDADGRRRDAAALAQRPYLLLYFSASWCGPCRSFTPTLVDYYRDLGEDRDVEIVMISRDKDSDRMLAYMKKYDMPWAALPMGSRRSQAIDKTYGGNGIPCLTLLGPEDEILAHSYVDGEYYGPNHVLRAYEQERGKRFLAQSLQAVKGERRPHALLRRLLVDDLIDQDGSVAADELGERRYLCLYFSASWCKPCRKFTPKLKSFYRQHGGGEAFDVVFVSSDREAKDMQRYYRSMPWLAARFGSMGAAALSARFAGPGIPCLVVLDATGRVVAHSYRGEDYVGPYAVLQELEQRVGG